MKKLLSFFASLSLLGSSTATVISCDGTTHGVAYGETGLLKDILKIDEKSISSYDNAQTLTEYIEQALKDLNEITLVNGSEAPTTKAEQIYNQKSYSLRMQDHSGNVTTTFGDKNERRFIFVNYTEKLVKGTLNESGDSIESPTELVELASDFASFAIINK